MKPSDLYALKSVSSIEVIIVYIETGIVYYKISGVKKGYCLSATIDNFLSNYKIVNKQTKTYLAKHPKNINHKLGE